MAMLSCVADVLHAIALPPVPRDRNIVTLELDSFTVGDVVDGRYELLEMIAAGAIGVVVRARHRFTQRVVALKLLHPWLGDDTGLIERTAREAQYAASLRHPNIVEIVDAGRTAEGHPFIAMEHLVGRTLREHLSGAPLPCDEVARLLAPIATAVATAHAAGIVHRDLKPENVMLVDDARGWIPKVLDFGFAAALEGARAQQRLTAAGTVLGTLSYMAPEQAIGTPTATSFDLYALGVMLYELLTGELPFVGDGYAEILRAKLVGAVDDGPLDRARVPRAWRALVRRCLAFDASARPDASELHRELLQLARPDAVRMPVAAQASASDRRRWLAIAGALAVVLAGAATLACQ
jgi:eukaryotic-like serine/threonine-protein kinase